MKKEELIQALKALSTIEWFLIHHDWIVWWIIWDHFDYISNLLIKELTNESKWFL